MKMTTCQYRKADGWSSPFPAEMDGPQTLVLVFGARAMADRPQAFGDLRTDEKLDAVNDGAPAGAGHVGFYAYGEICPASAGGGSELHNQTMTVTVFSEV